MRVGMFARPPLVAALLVVVLARDGTSQHHAAGWSYIHNRVLPGMTAFLGRCDLSGKMTTFFSSSQLPPGADYYFINGTVDVGDRSYVLALASMANPGALARVDQTGKILQFLQVLGKTPPQGGGMVRDVALDCDGNYLVVEGWSYPGQGNSLLSVSRSGVVSTVYQGPPLNDPWLVVTDIDTGDFLVMDGGWVYRIARDGSFIRPVGQFFPLSGLRTQFSQQVASGDLFMGGSGAPGAVLGRLDPLGTATTLVIPGVADVGGSQVDRSSAASPRIALGSAGSTNGLFFVDPTTASVTTLVALPNINEGFNHVLAPREVSTSKQGPGRWDILLHLAGEPGNSYAVGLSLSGVRPGLFLPDGRRVCLNVDALTFLSVLGGLGPIMPNPAGVLDGQASAIVALDVSTVPLPRGMRVWIQALTFDPAAPLGIRSIADPVLLVL